MTAKETDSMAGLVRSVLADTRELIRAELDLMRAEVREEVLSARAAGLAFGGAVFAGLLGLALFSVALGSAVAYWLDWPAWTGYAIVSVLLFAGACLAAIYGRKRLSNVRALPKTRATLKENLTWIQTKSAPK
jgi:hypothetical protein